MMNEDKRNESVNVHSENSDRSSASYVISRNADISYQSATKALLSLGTDGVNKLFNNKKSGFYSDCHEIIKGICLFIQNTIKEDYMRINDPRSNFNVSYDIDIANVPQEYDELVVNPLTTKYDRKDVDYLINTKVIPSIEDLYRFQIYLKIKLNCIPPCLIIAIIYLKRICEAANIALNIRNYKLLFIVSLIISQKIWVEPYKQTKEFAVLFPKDYSKDLLRVLERELLNKIYHNTKILSTDYGNLYKVLRSLANELVETTRSIDISFLNDTNSMIGDDKTIIPKIGKSKQMIISDTETETIHYIGKSNQMIISDTETETIQLRGSDKKYNSELVELAKVSSPEDLMHKGYKVIDYILAGFGLTALYKLGYTLKDIYKVQKTVLSSEGIASKVPYFSISDLQASKLFKVVDILDVGISLKDLKGSGFVKDEYVDSNVSLKQIIQEWYIDLDLQIDLKELKSIGFSVKDFVEINAGFHFKDYLNAGYTEDEISEVFDVHSNDMDIENDLSESENHSKIDISKFHHIKLDINTDVTDVNTKVSDSIDAKTETVSAISKSTEELFGKNVNRKETFLDLQKGGSSDKYIRNKGYKISDFIKAGYTPMKLLKADFHIDEILSIKQNVILENGDIKEIQRFQLKDFIEKDNFTINELRSFKSAGYSLEQFLELGIVFNLDEMISAGYTVNEITEAGYNYTIDDLLGVGYTMNELNKIGYTTNSIRETKQISEMMLKLKSSKFSDEQLKLMGYKVIDFINFGYEIIDLVNDAKFSLYELISTKRNINNPDGSITTEPYFNINQLREEGGFTIKDFLSIGYNLESLKSSGFTAQNYLKDEISVNDLLSSGYTIEELKKIGFSSKQINEKKAISTSLNVDISNKIKNSNALPIEGLKKLNLEENKKSQVSENKTLSEFIIIPPETKKLEYKKKHSIYFEDNSFPSMHNIANPDVGEILFCIAALIQAQVFQDLNAPIERHSYYPEFDIVPDLLPEFGGIISEIPIRVLNQESANDPLLREQLLKKTVPTIDTVLKFLALLRNRVHYTSEVNIMALIYLNKFTSTTKVPLKMTNWRSLWVMCLLLAQKQWDDSPMKNYDFNLILPDFSPSMLMTWELTILTQLNYTLIVQPSMYAMYYFELRQLFVEIIGPRTGSTIDLKYKSINRKYLSNLINGSLVRGLKNYSSLYGLNKLDSLSNPSIVNAYKSENLYSFDSLGYGYSASKDDNYIDRKKTSEKMAEYRVNQRYHRSQ